MNRKILLLEPNYKNKYPPMGLMKLATYFRKRNDDVRFFKGNLNDLAVDLLFEECWKSAGNKSFANRISALRLFIKDGRSYRIENIPDAALVEKIVEARKRYVKANYPKFEMVCVTTLFTFYWKETVATIENAKRFLSDGGKMIVGGIASTLLRSEFVKATGIEPFVNQHKGALLDKPGLIDADSTDIIDELPLDYSLLDETNYKYPASDSYFGYATRGCINHCEFCAVPHLEPIFCGFKSIKRQIEQSACRFGERKNLLLLDNNVLASNKFNAIIDEIKELGFSKGEFYHAPNVYEIAIKNIKDNYNTRTFIKKIIAFYDKVAELLPREELGNFYNYREDNGLLYPETASVDAILAFDNKFAPLYEKYVFSKIKGKRGSIRSVDFNQGLDARLLTEEKMKKLAEINIIPLRIAFDHWDIDPQRPSLGSMRYIYRNAVELAAKYGIRDLSNYLLFNTDEDTPDDLYKRIQMNVNLCDELNIRIYSFPMKYHPIDNPQFFMNRNFIGKYWKRKYIRAIQAILNSTHGKIGQGKNFFEAAFGKDIETFKEILIMPETFIIERYKYDSDAYELYLTKGGRENPNITKEVIKKYGGLTKEWRTAFHNLSEEQKKSILQIIEHNIFTNDIISNLDLNCKEVMKYYLIKRHGQSTNTSNK